MNIREHQEPPLPTSTEYKRRVVEYLKSGKASEAVWNEVAEGLLAESELCGALQLDVELGLAQVCACGKRVWIGGVGAERCECGRRSR